MTFKLQHIDAMFKVELRPEVKKELKDPDLFSKGLSNVYTGLTVIMCGVLLMLFLYFQKPEHVLHPTWLLFIGFGIVGGGEWQKICGK